MIKGVIFDMDGLLIDSEPLWQEAEMEIFSELGVPLTKKMMEKTMGLRIDEVVKYWFSRYPWAGVKRKEVEDRVVNRVIELIKEKGKPQKGVQHIFKLFAGQKIPIALASSSQTKIINIVLKKLSVRNYIKVIHSAESELYGKPHPGVYITTAKKMGLSPNECLAFEDSPNGVLAAKAARIKCVAVPEKFVEKSKIFNIADLKIRSLEEFTLKDISKF